MIENISKCQWLKLKLYNSTDDLLEEWTLSDIKLLNIFWLEYNETDQFNVEFNFEFKNVNYNSCCYSSICNETL